ncbi:tRNA (adenosine(37)-N6)-threonylcarbamoyltransferase complex transferase subunit TsaD [bacterium]|nr:tRNA (adenosine(37)-N6)-threonylcarbamoyltransferase complex transferase subunit TsaD [bacterium]
MYVLGVETSCDETAASLLTGDFNVLSNIILSQDEIHAPYGGIVPELASRQHISSIPYVVKECLNRAQISIEEVDVYAVTQGPGLVGSLLVGLSFSKGLAYYFGKPLIPVDHLEAHIQSAFLENRETPYPVLALLVSGGHTSLFYLEKRLQYELVGKTRDDAAGEALDKIAKFLDLGYPGGPIIDKRAQKGNPRKFPFGVPRMSDRTLDFSFSGLKTAALRYIRKSNLQTDHPQLNDFLASFQQAVIKALLSNLTRAIRKCNPRSLILCGGVARNQELRKKFLSLARKSHLPAYIPSPQLCTDNAAMVAGLALEKIQSGQKGDFSLDVNAYPRFHSS